MGTNDLNFQANKLIVYPNPSSGIINFKNVDKGSLIEIFSITGKKVFQKNILNNSIELNLPNGLYFLKTNGTTFKLIIDN